MSIKLSLFEILSGDSSVTDKVTSWTKNDSTRYAIFSASLIPSKISTDSDPLKLSVKDTTVNYYQSGIISGGSMVINTTYSISCRAYKENDAEALQQACYEALNRVKSTDNRYFYVCSKLQTITPSDKTDNYNAVVEVNVKGSNT